MFPNHTHAVFARRQVSAEAAVSEYQMAPSPELDAAAAVAAAASGQ